jgi:4'-phosphopantetheinyl transferase EntD
VIERLLPPCAATAEAFTDLPGEAPFPGEADLIANAVEVRRREFITARRCARQALAALGQPTVAIRPGPGRAPTWPAGVIGSITHCAGYRAAAVAPRADLAGIGIDAEPHSALPDGVAALVTADGEPAMLRDLAAAAPAVHWDRVLFSAKEAVYKAWYPLTGRWLDFDAARVSLDPAAASFHARILVDGARADGGPELADLHGRYLIANDLVLTAVSVAV